MDSAIGGRTLALASLLAARLGMAGVPPPSAEIFGALPQTDQVAISPNGNTLAWNIASDTQQKIVVFDAAAGKDKRVQLLPSPSKLRSLSWSDDETLLIEVSLTGPDVGARRRYEIWRTLALNVNSGVIKPLLMAGGGYRAYATGADILATHTDKPKTVVMSTVDFNATEARMETGSRVGERRGDSGWRLNVYEVDTRTGDGKELDEGSPYTSDWVVDRNGNVVAREDWNPDGEVYRVLAKSGLGWREIFHQEKHGQLKLLAPSADGSMVLALGPMAGVSSKLWGLPLDGSPPHVVVEDATREVEGVIWDGFARLPVAAVLGGPDMPYKWIDGDEQKRFETLEKTFRGKQVGIWSESQDHQRLVVKVSTTSTPAVFYLVDFRTHHAEIIGEGYPDLARASLGEVKAITYKARDGTDIPAYLTLPPDMPPKNLPLVVLPHGGPEARDLPEFNWWAQFLATRGYAVLQPQFRGSTGFGNAFRLAGRQQWGGLMQDDVTDGVKSLTAQGVADAHRVCIVGASYGGYAALAGAAYTPDLYVCAASINGVSDLPQAQYWVEQHYGTESNALGYWRESIGTHLQDLQAHSPRSSVDAIRVPLLIMYSADDTLVAPDQSLDMVRALTRAGKSVKLVKLPGDDHWLSHSQTRTQMLKELDGFLAAQLH
jgi:dipeptidyl aminopeptidase/acylaminoacyl peptidase